MLQSFLLLIWTQFSFFFSVLVDGEWIALHGRCFRHAVSEAAAGGRAQRQPRHRGGPVPDHRDSNEDLCSL